MKNYRLLFIYIPLLIIAGCTATKKTGEVVDPTVQKLADANAAFNAGEYQKALTSYEDLINLYRTQKKPFDTVVFQNAGIAAFELKQFEKSMQMLEVARRTSHATPKTFTILVQISRQADNLSKEITNLEGYINKFPQGEEIGNIRKQLFDAYVRSENWDLAYKLWPSLDKTSQNDVRVLNGFLVVNQKLEYKDQAEKIAAQVLKLDKNSITALEILAEKYYWLAENTYLKEMRAYESNQTDKQYKQLLAAWDGLNKNYQTSLDYFLRLYKLDPKTRNAQFIGNIYNRFKNKEKADYYYNLAKKK